MYGNSTQRRNNVDPYLTQKVMSASPEQLIAYIYDAAITGCAREDRSRAMRAVQELINALNFDNIEIARNFLNLYRYILDQIGKGKFDEAKQLLTEFKSIWTQAMKVQ